MSKLVLDDVLEYVAEKTGDVQTAESFLLDLNQDELEYMFDMAEKHHEKPVRGGIGGKSILTAQLEKDLARLSRKQAFHPFT